jgi:hypothetical protein
MQRYDYTDPCYADYNYFGPMEAGQYYLADDVDARIAELEKALREAMEWNWLDEDMNQGVANACERVLNGGTF